jgi:hypothetical protein
VDLPQSMRGKAGAMMAPALPLLLLLQLQLPLISS